MLFTIEPEAPIHKETVLSGGCSVNRTFERLVQHISGVYEISSSLYKKTETKTMHSHFFGLCEITKTNKKTTPHVRNLLGDFKY